MDLMLLTCLMVSGKRRERTITVTSAMLNHHAKPHESWKYSRPEPSTLVRGLKTLSRNWIM
jgi:hypothetical protein